jgi:hypothetical protein|tara:strand:+ start:1444 stop:2283 length:840 start_codon:yes stop_codon:yes gene_type:complete
MDILVGLGNVGYKLTKVFEKHPQYKIITIDHEPDATICVPKCKHPEEYEKSFPSIKKHFAGLNGEILFIVSGASVISGASLRVLQQMQGIGEISILYIHPDVDTLSETRRLQTNVTLGVLQQYARSGVFKQFYAVDNQMIDKILGGAPIMGYYDSLNEIVAATIHMINVFNHSEPVVGTLSDPRTSCRISTFGILNPETGEEKPFFLLDNVMEKRYYYAIPEEELKTDKTLMGKIMTQVKDTPQEKDIKVSYGVFSTQYAEKYAYFVASTASVQNEKSS